MHALDVKNLSKFYNGFLAVDNISFSVDHSEIFGILGPNGAGKTTTLEMIEGIRKIDSGQVFIDNLNIKSSVKQIKQIIGVQLQTTFLYDKIRLDELLELFASYYKDAHSTDYILKLLSLYDKRKTFFENLSGGQKQRVSLGLAIINNPKIIFLDEPTAGIDPHARRNIWNIVRQMKKEGKSIILSTHHMEEAQTLCDRVAIMDKGKIIDIDSPKNLVKKHNLSSSIHFPINNVLAKEELKKLDAVTELIVSKNHYTLFSKSPMKTLDRLMILAKNKNIKLKHITLKEPNLEDLFMELTGRDLKDGIL